MSDDAMDKIKSALLSVTKDFTTAKRQSDKQNRISQQQLTELRRATRPIQVTIKEASYWAMENAYNMASGNGKYPANARQVMYAARPLVLATTGGRCWQNSSTFTQQYLPDFIEEHPDLTASWDVVFDARGRLVEPHTGDRTDLGTLEVRRYVKAWTEDVDDDLSVELKHDVDTKGPGNRYKFALFVEKEGFYPLLEQAQIANRYDLAIMSTKGMSVTAARSLVDKLSQQGVTILVARDFDKAGFSIVYTLCHSTRRYYFARRPKVIDIGLRLSDVQDMGLQSERVEYRCDVSPRDNLVDCGATEEEAAYLVLGKSGGAWVGDRVELNAMTSAQFIEWLERKMEEHGVKKLVPDMETLTVAYRRAYRRAIVQQAIDDALEEAEDADTTIPDGLAKLIEKRIEGTAKSWDTAVFELLQENRAISEPEIGGQS